MLTHSTSNYTMQVTAAGSMINASSSSPLKLVDVVFTKNLESLAHTLKKCQIPLLVDDCPALILQFDQQQLLMHQNTTSTGIPLSSSSSSSHECCCPSICSQKQKLITANIKSQTTLNTSNNNNNNNNSNSKICNMCNSLSNAQKKGYDTFLNKYNKCSSSNQSLDLELEVDVDDTSENVTCSTMSLETKANACTCANQINSTINTATIKAGLSSCPRLIATQNELMSTLSKMVSCIGCRTSVERFYKQLVCANNSRQVNLLNLDKNMQRKNVSYSYSGSGNGGNGGRGGRGGFSAGMGMGGNASALDPFIIRANGNLTLKKSFLMDPLSIYKLFYMNW
jgi:hypothetical protein